MPWVKLSDDWYDDPKLIKAGPICLSLWVVGLSWSARNLTDGEIPRAKVKSLVDFEGIGWQLWTSPDGFGGGQDVDPLEVADRLVEFGLWERKGDDYVVANYLKYQPSREQVLSAREQDAQRKRAGRDGRKGAQEAAEDGGATRSEGVEEDSTERPNGVQPESARPVPVPVPESPKGLSKPRKAAKRKTDFPEDFAVTDDMRQWAASEVPGVDVDFQTKQFRDHHAGKGSQYVDWKATWRTWMRNAKSWGYTTRGNGQPPPRQVPLGADLP